MSIPVTTRAVALTHVRPARQLRTTCIRLSIHLMESRISYECIAWSRLHHLYTMVASVLSALGAPPSAPPWPTSWHGSRRGAPPGEPPPLQEACSRRLWAQDTSKALILEGAEIYQVAPLATLQFEVRHSKLEIYPCCA